MKLKLFSILICFLTAVCSVFAQYDKATKFDEMYSGDCCELWMRNLDVYVTELQKYPNSKGYIIYYGGKFFRNCGEKKNRLPKKGEAEIFVSIQRDYLKRFRIYNNQLTFVDGGFREVPTLELWIVPPSSELPKATPTYEKKQIKFGKGKASRKRIFSSCIIG